MKNEQSYRIRRKRRHSLRPISRGWCVTDSVYRDIGDSPARSRVGEQFTVL
jgi:hypothetical protein